MRHVHADPDIPPPGLAQDLSMRVAQARGGMSANDERILAFVRAHLPELAFHTADSLAQGAGVSAAAVVRFARRLGYASFRELRDRARDELQAASAPGSADGAAAHDTTLGRKTLQDTASLALLPGLLEEPLAAAARRIAAAGTTWFVAGRETYGLALYTQRLLHHVRRDVRLVDPAFPDPLDAAGAGDAVVAITFRPYARQTLGLLGHARLAGARVVLVTDGGSHPFIEPDDAVLAVPVDSPTLMLSFTPAVCVLEALAAEVAMLDADQTHDTLERTGHFASEQRLVVERMATPKDRR